jgi:hypothetical protein
MFSLDSEFSCGEGQTKAQICLLTNWKALLILFAKQTAP